MTLVDIFNRHGVHPGTLPRLDSFGDLIPISQKNYDALTADVVRWLRRDPIFSLTMERQRQQIARQEMVSIRSAVDVLGEQRAFVLRLLIDSNFGSSTTAPPDSLNTLRAAAAAEMVTARPYLWRDDIRYAAANTTVPPHVIPRMVLPFQSCWFTWEYALGPDPVTKTQSEGCLLRQREKHLQVIHIFAHQDPPHRLTIVFSAVQTFPARWPDDFGPHNKERQVVESILSWCSFVRSPFIEKEKLCLPRAVRPQKRRTGSPPLVHMVRLRARKGDSPESATGANASTSDRTRHHRWIVSGHHRAQWYPSKQEHHVIWISPHEKGPPDKPLRVKAYSVER